MVFLLVFQWMLSVNTQARFATVTVTNRIIIE